MKAGELEKIRAAALELKRASPERKNAVLLGLKHALEIREPEAIEVNKKDLDRLPREASSAFRDRLTLTPGRLSAIRESLQAIADFPDPVGEVVEAATLPNGLKLKRVRSPLGVVFLIFESRPNVAIEAFALALKSGNAIILRGGRESVATTAFFYELMKEALRGQGLSENIVAGVTDPDRAIVETLLKENRYIDVVIPRGGEALIEFVQSHSRIPIIKNDRGLCHVYVDADADLGMAAAIVENAKTQRPGVCNAMETLLVHSAVAAAFLPEIHERLRRFNVRWHGCARTLELLRDHSSGDVLAAHERSWDTEYLDLELSCRVVEGFDQALAHIEKHGSRHSEAIVTQDEATARRFQSEVDAAVVYWNASTRFTDGFELGLGGEIGISTQKLHVRGPVGSRELTSVRWVIDGSGQVRSQKGEKAT